MPTTKKPAINFGWLFIYLWYINVNIIGFPSFAGYVTIGEIMEKVMAFQFKSINIINPATFEGAIVYAIVFLVFALVLNRMMRLAVQRALARGSRVHIDRNQGQVYIPIGPNHRLYHCIFHVCPFYSGPV